MNHGSNVIGTVQDVATVGKVCRERGIHLIVDVEPDRRHGAGEDG